MTTRGRRAAQFTVTHPPVRYDQDEETRFRRSLERTLAQLERTVAKNNDIMVAKSFETSDLPGAGTVEEGTFLWDQTTDRPKFSDGTNWHALLYGDEDETVTGSWTFSSSGGVYISEGVYTGDGDDSNSIFQSAGYGRYGMIGVNLVYDGSGDPPSNMNYIDDTADFGQAGIVLYLGSNNPKFEVHKADDVDPGDAGTNAPLSKIFGVDASGNGTFWNHSGRVTLFLRSDSAGTGLGSTIRFVHNNTAQMEIIYHNSNDELRIVDSQSAGTKFQFRTNGSLYLTQHNTTASGANANINSSTGELRRTTSSLRYKRDVRDLGRGRGRNMALALRPIIYKSDIETDDQEIDWLGFAAEEVAQLHPSLVSYDEEGEPSGIYYDRLVVPLTTVVQDHERRLQKLERQGAP